MPEKSLPVFEVAVVSSSPVKETKKKSTTNVKKIIRKKPQKNKASTKSQKASPQKINSSIVSSQETSLLKTDSQKTAPNDKFVLKARPASELLGGSQPVYPQDLAAVKKPVTKETENLARLNSNIKLTEQKTDYSDSENSSNLVPDEDKSFFSDNLSATKFLGIDSAKSLNFYKSLLAYQNHLIAKVQKHWHPKVARDIQQFPVVQAYIKPDGSLLKTDLIASSNDEFLDTLALNAIKLAAPFPELPADFPVGKIFVVPFKFKNEAILF